MGTVTCSCCSTDKAATKNLTTETPRRASKKSKKRRYSSKSQSPPLLKNGDHKRSKKKKKRRNRAGSSSTSKDFPIEGEGMADVTGTKKSRKENSDNDDEEDVKNKENDWQYEYMSVSCDPSSNPTKQLKTQLTGIVITPPSNGSSPSREFEFDFERILYDDFDLIPDEISSCFDDPSGFKLPGTTLEKKKLDRDLRKLQDDLKTHTSLDEDGRRYICLVILNFYDELQFIFDRYCKAGGDWEWLSRSGWMAMIRDSQIMQDESVTEDVAMKPFVRAFVSHHVLESSGHGSNSKKKGHRSFGGTSGHQISPRQQRTGFAWSTLSEKTSKNLMNLGDPSSPEGGEGSDSGSPSGSGGGASGAPSTPLLKPIHSLDVGKIAKKAGTGSSNLHDRTQTAVFQSVNFGDDSDPWSGIWKLAKGNKIHHHHCQKSSNSNRKESSNGSGGGISAHDWSTIEEDSFSISRQHTMKDDSSLITHRQQSYDSMGGSRSVPHTPPGSSLNQSFSLTKTVVTPLDTYVLKHIGDRKIIGCIRKFDYSEINGSLGVIDHTIAKMMVKYKSGARKGNTKRMTCKLIAPDFESDENPVLRIHVDWQGMDKMGMAKHGHFELEKISTLDKSNVHNHPISLPNALGLSRWENWMALIRLARVLYPKKIVGNHPFKSLKNVIQNNLIPFIYKKYISKSFIDDFKWKIDGIETILHHYGTEMRQLYQHYQGIDNEIDRDEWVHFVTNGIFGLSSKIKKCQPPAYKIIQAFNLGKAQMEIGLNFQQFGMALFHLSYFLDDTRVLSFLSGSSKKGKRKKSVFKPDEKDKDRLLERFELVIKWTCTHYSKKIHK